MILGTEILSYEEFDCETMQISEESRLYTAKRKQSNNLASNLPHNQYYQYE